MMPKSSKYHYSHRCDFLTPSPSTLPNSLSVPNTCPSGLVNTFCPRTFNWLFPAHNTISLVTLYCCLQVFIQMFPTQQSLLCLLCFSFSITLSTFYNTIGTLSNILYLLFTVPSPHKSMNPQGQRDHLFCLFIYPLHLESCLEHNCLSTNILKSI